MYRVMTKREASKILPYVEASPLSDLDAFNREMLLSMAKRLGGMECKYDGIEYYVEISEDIVWSIPSAIVTQKKDTKQHKNKRKR